jgi:hypothetical protein
MKAVSSGLLTAAAVLLFAGSAYAQPVTQTVNISANLTAKAKLDLGGATAVSFPDQDPDAAATLTATSTVNVTVKARTSAGGGVTLTVQSDGDLMSGATDAIPIGNLTWTAGGDLSAGTMTKAPAAAATLGSWSGPGQKSGSQVYQLLNSWDYVTGNYTAIITYTLTAP